MKKAINSPIGGVCSDVIERYKTRLDNGYVFEIRLSSNDVKQLIKKYFIEDTKDNDFIDFTTFINTEYMLEFNLETLDLEDFEYIFQYYEKSKLQELNNILNKFINK